MTLIDQSYLDNIESIVLDGIMSRIFFNNNKLSSVKMYSDVSKVERVDDMFAHITTTGVFTYNARYDYSHIIAVLPSTWKAVAGN